MSEPIKKPNQTPDGYSPKKPEIIHFMNDALTLNQTDLPAQFSITERGIRDSQNCSPRNVQHPAMINALKIFMGIECKPGNYDYIIQMAITGGGFCVFYDPLQNDHANKWGDQFFRNSLDIEGFLYHIAAISAKYIYDSIIDPTTLKKEICAHLSSDKPLIILKRENNLTLLVTGYKNDGDVLIAYPFSDGAAYDNIAVKLKENCKEYVNWELNLESVIYVDGIHDVPDINVIIRQTLKTAYEMLTDKSLVYDENNGGFRYGELSFKTWISLLEEDENYVPGIDICYDFAERRCYSSFFFKECEKYLNNADLSQAVEAFQKICDNSTNKILNMAREDNEGKKLNLETRNKIIALVKECRTLELVAAENIRCVLEHEEI